MTDWSLRGLDNPYRPVKAVDLSRFPRHQLLDALKNMLRIRSAEEKLAVERQKVNIGGPVHLGIGQ